MSDSEDAASVYPTANNEDPVDNQSTISLISSLLDSKLKASVKELKRSLCDKDFETQREIKKIRSEAKTASSFKHKGNRLQYEFNLKVLDQLTAAKKKLTEGHIDEVLEEIESAIKDLTKRNKYVRFADKSQAGWAAVEEYQSDELADDSEDEKKLRSAEKRALAKIKATKSAKTKKFYDRRASHSDQAMGRPSNLGFPAFNNRPFRGQRQPQSYDRCFSCQQRGHWADTPACPNYSRGRYTPTATNTATSATSGPK